MRLAILADIHGNVAALEAVLDDLRGQEIEAICNLGDHLSGPLWAAETAKVLMSATMVQIRGNHDRQLLDRAVSEMGPSDRAAYGELTQEHKQWLGSLPGTAAIAGLYLCHGSPASDLEYLLERANGSGLSGPAEIEARLDGIPEKLVACGHSHQPRVVRAGERLILNPGSVGLPAYNAEDHDMECGSPHARYAIVEMAGERVTVAQRVIEYDWERAARRAEERERPDWAYALRTGFAWRATSS